jgi:hypothetical protein
LGLFHSKSEEIMSTEPVNWEAALAEVEAQILILQAMAEGARVMIALKGGAPSPSGGGGLGPSAYLGMSIPEATKKYLMNVRQKKSTQEVAEALEAGGLPKSKYNTVYSILRRRESQVGDVINMQGDWALAEWYPGYKRKKSSGEELDELEKNAQEMDEMEGKATKSA